MRKEHDVLEREERGLDSRLALVDVKTGTGDHSLPQRVGEGPFIHNRSARRVDQDPGPLHLAQPLRIHEMARFGQQRHMQRNEVTSREKIVKSGDERRSELALRVLVASRIVVQDGHREALRASRERPADPPHADDPKRRVVHVLPGEHERRPPAVLPCAEEALSLTEPARRRQEEREGSISCGLVEDARRERDRDLTLLRRGDVDVVVSGAHRRDHPETLRAADGFGVDGVRGKRVDDIGVSDHPRDLVGGRDRRLLGSDDNVGAWPQHRERLGRDRSRDHDLHERGGAYCGHNSTVAKRVAVDEVGAHNERMWERLAKAGIPYTRPQGSPPKTKPGKRRFLDDLTDGSLGGFETEGKRVLCLAGGGGWHAILFAELGADTTLFDISSRQLATVRELARRRGTELAYVRGDMRDLSALGNGEFDLVYHNHSIVFVPDAARVIGEVSRVLALGGLYIFSTMHPVTIRMYESWTGTGWRFKKRYFEDGPIPLADPTWEFGKIRVRAPTLEYGHRVADLVRACSRSGLVIDGLWEYSPSYEGGPAGSEEDLERQLPAFIRFRARKIGVTTNGPDGANGSRPRTDPPSPPAFSLPPGYSPPNPRRRRDR